VVVCLSSFELPEVSLETALETPSLNHYSCLVIISIEFFSQISFYLEKNNSDTSDKALNLLLITFKSL